MHVQKNIDYIRNLEKIRQEREAAHKALQERETKAHEDLLKR